MALHAKKTAPAARGRADAARLMRLVRFPAVRRMISSGLDRAVPEKAHVTPGYVRFRLKDPSLFVPQLFSTIPVGRRGTMLVIGTLRKDVRDRAKLSAFLGRMRRALGSSSRRSLLYQLRSAGIIGGATTQAVLVPRRRVEAVAARFASRPSARGAAANPILATLGFNPGPRRARRNAAGMGTRKPWNLYAGGTAAAPGKRAYDIVLPFGRYSISPVSWPNGRHRGYLVHFINDKGRLAGGLWQQLGLARSPNAAKWLCAAHLMRHFRSAGNPLNRRESLNLLRGALLSARVAKVEDPDSELRGFFAGRAAGRADAVKRFGRRGQRRSALRIERAAGRLLSSRRRYTGSASRNPGDGAPQGIHIPFRTGQKVTTLQIERWLAGLPEGWLKRRASARFEQAKRQYKSFHLGKLPPHWTFNPQGLGMSPHMTDIDFVVSEGKEWMAPYQVPKHSGKYERRTQGRYVHAHGDSKLDVDVKRPVSTRKLPERFHTPDGKFVGVIPSRNVKIGAWYTG